MLIARAAEPTLRQLAGDYPVVAITGPRQSGKTTLVRVVFAERPYVSLEDLDERELASADPRSFLARFPDGAVLDEVQRAPELLSFLQRDVDETRQPGRWVLTGSQQFGLLSGVTQSLAGRIALVPLLPFSLSELQESDRRPGSIEELLFTGLYPPIHDRRLEPSRWYGNYVATYLERDVRQMINVRDLSAFRLFLRLCAARAGQLLNLSGLATDCGITHNTARAWLSVLEASYLVYLLPPHHRNLGKRLIKSPKLYFLDPGLAAWLLGIERSSDLATHAQRGPLFEGWVVAEGLKARYHQALRSNLFFWRSRAGLEVDVVAERHGRLSACEVKSGRTLASDAFDSLERWSSLAGDEAGDLWLIYAGDTSLRRKRVRVCAWHDIARWTDSLVRPLGSRATGRRA